MSKNNSLKYLPQITMLLKHIFLNSYPVELGITVSDGRAVFSHNLLFLRKLSLFLRSNIKQPPENKSVWLI